MKTLERQLRKRIKDLEQREREANIILSTMIIMEFDTHWPKRTREAVDDWMKGNSIWDHSPTKVKSVKTATKVIKDAVAKYKNSMVIIDDPKRKPTEKEFDEYVNSLNRPK